MAPCIRFLIIIKETRRESSQELREEERERERIDIFHSTLIRRDRNGMFSLKAAGLSLSDKIATLSL
jgi:hypothetical protein